MTNQALIDRLIALHDEALSPLGGRSGFAETIPEGLARLASGFASNIERARIDDEKAKRDWWAWISPSDVSWIAAQSHDLAPSDVLIIDEFGGEFCYAALLALAVSQSKARVSVYRSLMAEKWSGLAIASTSKPEFAEIEYLDHVERHNWASPVLVLAKLDGAFDATSTARVLLVDVLPRLPFGSRVMIHDCHPGFVYPWQRAACGEFPVLLQVLEALVANSKVIQPSFFTASAPGIEPNNAGALSAWQDGRASFWFRLGSEAVV